MLKGALIVFIIPVFAYNSGGGGNAVLCYSNGEEYLNKWSCCLLKFFGIPLKKKKKKKKNFSFFFTFSVFSTAVVVLTFCVRRKERSNILFVTNFLTDVSMR